MPSSYSLDLGLNWHLASQVLGRTVLKMFPNVQLAGGGINSIGFYYDFFFEQPFLSAMLELIEVEMQRFIKEGHEVRSLSMMRENAQSLFEHKGHPILAELTADEENNIVELVQMGDFYGLCPPLTFDSSDQIGIIKLLKGNSQPDDSIRIYGTSQLYAQDLKAFLKTYDYFLKKQDHRLLGPKLDLFSFSSEEEFGVIWHPKGIVLQRLLQDWLKNQLPETLSEVSTPVVVKFKTQDRFQEEMEPLLFDGSEFTLRSSFLSQHLEAFFKENYLPMQVTEFGQLYRQIPPSQRWGLFSSCSFLCEQTTLRSEKTQLLPQLISSLQFIERIITIFGFTARWILIGARAKTPKAKGESYALGLLRKAYQEAGCKTPLSTDMIEEEGKETPRLELRIEDGIGREWPLSSIAFPGSITDVGLTQFASPYQVIWTRRIFGSLDRLIALLIEHYEGNFPLWLAPEQIRVLAIGEYAKDYASDIGGRLKQAGLRVKLDLRDCKVAVKIHEAESENVPYLVLIGEQEKVKERISLRAKGKVEQDLTMEILLRKLEKEN